VPPVDAPGPESGRQLPAAVGLAFPSSLPGRTATQVARGPEGETRYVLPIGDAVVDTYASLAPRLFERVQRVAPGAELPPEARLDGALEVDLGEVAMSLPTANQAAPCRVSLRQTFSLRDAKGGLVARWDAAGSGEAPRGAFVDCGGKAAAGALAEAAAALSRGLDGDPAVRAWLAGMGRRWDPPGAPREVRQTWRAEPDEEAVAASRVFGVSGGVGWFFAASSEDHLPGAQGGLALSLGATWQPWPWLALDLRLDNLSSTYSSALVQPAPSGPVGTLTLNQTLFAPVARLGWPIGIVFPWAGGGPIVGIGVLSGPPAAGDGVTSSSSSTSFAYGALAGAGVDVAVTRNVVLAARWSWVWTWMDLGGLSRGATEAGGSALVVSGGYFWP
jgi:hypothetical protein